MNEKIKVYTYTRVSTAMQIDGYSLEAQRNRMKAYAEFNDYEIVSEYEDAGKSGKSIEGRTEFMHMMEDIKCGKDNISYVLVFKLSRSRPQRRRRALHPSGHAGLRREPDSVWRTASTPPRTRASCDDSRSPR